MFVNMQSCPLCKCDSVSLFVDDYYECNNCRGIFLSPDCYLSVEDEKGRYQEHNNDVDDEGYQKFVSPITDSILRDFNCENIGLDFGAGTGPVISKILHDNNYNILQYDPFFHDYKELLNKRYDYIACCEVIEHFHDPGKEFLLLKDLLNPNGRLYCMTHIYDHKIDFTNWYYRNDPTHVFIYTKETLKWIKDNYQFAEVYVKDRLVIFEIGDE